MLRYLDKMKLKVKDVFDKNFFLHKLNKLNQIKETQRII